MGVSLVDITSEIAPMMISKSLQHKDENRSDEAIEEGEIVDDCEYEFIISSDDAEEEDNIIKRIKELEATNDELEKIARISGSYANEYNYSNKNAVVPLSERNQRMLNEPCNSRTMFQRAAKIPTDASSISSVEFTTPKKRKRRKAKTTKNKTYHDDRSYKVEHYGRHNQHHHHTELKKRRHGTRQLTASSRRMHFEKNVDTVSIESCDDSDEREAHLGAENNLALISDDEEYDVCFLNRAELRFALARNNNKESNNPCSLKERLRKEKSLTSLEQNESPKMDTEKLKSTKIPMHIEDDKLGEECSDNSVSLEEQELRLIALKSAVIKKHLARKKRNAELAYSPTDFEDMLAVVGNCNTDDNMDVVEVDDDLDDMQASMEISPVTSPRLLLSPAEIAYGETNHISNGPSMVDTKPVDMDIANSESEDEPLIYLVNQQECNKWVPIEQIPLPNAMKANEVNMVAPIASHYGTFMSEIHYEAPPPPPGVTDYEEVAPPPPPFHIASESAESCSISEDTSASDCSMECFSANEDLSTSKVDIVEPNWSANNANSISKSPVFSDAFSDNSQDAEQYGTENEHVTDDNGDEEEEEALRALLLSKFQSPKNSKTTNTPKANETTEQPLLASAKETEDPEILRLILLENMSVVQKSNEKPTESILKEAVRRLKLKTNSTHSNNGKMYETNAKQDIRQKSLGNSPLTTEGHSNETITTAVEINVELENKEQLVNNLNIKHKSNMDSDNTSSKKRKLSTDCEQENATNILTAATDLLDNSIDNAKKQIQNEPIKAKLITNEVNKVSTSKELQTSTKKDSKEFAEEILPSSELELNDTLKQNEIIADARELANAALTNKTNSHPDVEVKLESAEAKVNRTLCSEETSLMNDPLAHEPIQTVISKSKAILTKSSDLPKNIHATKSNQSLLASSGSNITNTSSLLAAKYPLKKIVKPNKVINTNSAERIFKSFSPKPDTTLFNSANTPNVSASKSNSRLIAAVDLPKLQVKRLIITLRASDTETSEDDEVQQTLQNCKTSDSLASSIDNNYHDNTSPVSLPMESPSTTPIRSNSPSTEVAQDTAAEVEMGTITKSIVNDFFKQKLDSFLKNVRSKVQQTAAVSTTKSACATPKRNLVPETTKTINTPVAVRHLPDAAQQEYRRLVHRMNMLEKQKKSKNPETTAEVSSKTTLKLTKQAQPVPDVATPTSLPQTSHISAIKPTLIKKVLVKNTVSNSTKLNLTSDLKKNSKANTKHEPSKVNVLHSYENSFVKIGAGIISNLDKSLKLVEQAKKTKVAKLHHEQRLKELRAEMEEVQHKFKQEQLKMTKIFPEICNSNEVITTLKQRRVKLFNAATSLGKSIKGEDYRLNNELKSEISMKSKKLAMEIKRVNSIKLGDLKTKENEEFLTCTNSTKSPTKAGELTTDSSTFANVNNIQNKSPPKDISAENESEKTMNNTEPQLSKNVDPQSNNINSANCEVNTQVLIAPTVNDMQIIEEMQLNKNDEFQVQREEEPALNGEKEEPITVKEDGVDFDQTVDSEQGPSVYISPLQHLKNIKSELDPNGIICPYELMGQCEDSECKYTHLTCKEPVTT